MQVLITVIGIVQLARGKTSPSLQVNLFEGSSTSPSAYALALYSGLWAYDGWDQTNYVGGEMKNPEKNIPRAIHLSMFIVIVSVLVSHKNRLLRIVKTLFSLANLSYFVVLDKARRCRGPAIELI